MAYDRLKNHLKEFKANITMSELLDNCINIAFDIGFKCKEIQDQYFKEIEATIIEICDEIVPNMDTSFDIDKILDKINKYGIKSLTPLEKEYLNKL